jgi:hypothetical protein
VGVSRDQYSFLWHLARTYTQALVYSTRSQELHATPTVVRRFRIPQHPYIATQERCGVAGVVLGVQDRLRAPLVEAQGRACAVQQGVPMPSY